MNAVAIGWLMILGFGLYNTLAARVFLRQRNRLDLFWLPVSATLFSWVLYAWLQNPLVLLVFIFIQSISFLLLLRLAPPQK